MKENKLFKLKKEKKQQLSLYLCCSVSGMVTSWCSHLLSGSCSEPINRCEKKALATKQLRAAGIVKSVTL